MKKAHINFEDIKRIFHNIIEKIFHIYRRLFVSSTKTQD